MVISQSYILVDENISLLSKSLYIHLELHVYKLLREYITRNNDSNVTIGTYDSVRMI